MSTTRAAGQIEGLPGAVRRGNVVTTSGVVSTSALSRAGVPAAQQVDEAVSALLGVLDEVGASPSDVIRVEAFIGSVDVMPAWNERFGQVWGQLPPARTTLIVGFARPELLFEVQAIAVLDDDE
jgi:2-iminobutanoate/2-iminopropanoate deaminase